MPEPHGPAITGTQTPRWLRRTVVASLLGGLLLWGALAVSWSSPSCWRCGANGRRTTHSTVRARRAEPAHCTRPLCQERALASSVLGLGGQGLITGVPSPQTRSRGAESP